MRDKSPLKAIQEKCLDCVCGSYFEIARCDIEDCSLWRYRFGRRPETAKRKGKNVERKGKDVG